MTKKLGLTIDICQPWIILMNDDKFITITVHNDTRDNHGSMSIQLTSPWKDQAKDYGYKPEKTIIVDDEEKFIKLYEALKVMKNE